MKYRVFTVEMVLNKQVVVNCMQRLCTIPFVCLIVYIHLCRVQKFELHLKVLVLLLHNMGLSCVNMVFLCNRFGGQPKRRNISSCARSVL